MFGDARKEFERAYDLDPGFQQAQTEAQQMVYLDAARTDESTTLEDFSVQTSDDTEWAGFSSGATDQRLSSMLNNTGLVRTTGTDGSNDENPYTPPSDEQDTSTEVIIHGRFD